MSFKKDWSTGEKQVVRSKPYVETSDSMDELAELAAEWDRANHDTGDCQRDCPHCEAEVQADLDQHARQVKQAMDIFDLVTAWVRGTAKP